MRKKTNRIRVTATGKIISREDAEQSIAVIASLTLQRNAAQIMLDDFITKLREKSGPEIAELNTWIEAETELVRAWAEANPGEFPKGKKSLELAHGTIGFRTGTPKLKTIGRKTWAAVLATIKSLGISDWIRTEESVNRERIISDARGGLADEVPQAFVDKQIRAIGVEVVQDETFFIEPKLEELKTRITETAA